MTYILFIYIFAVGGQTPTEIETYKYSSFAECRAGALKIQGEIAVPTESLCVEVPNG